MSEPITNVTTNETTTGNNEMKDAMKQHLLSIKVKTPPMMGHNEKAVPSAIKQQASFRMYLAAFSALLGAIGFGLGIGWSAPAFESMSKEGSVPRLVEPEDSEILSWIGSTLTLSALFGALFSGFIVQQYGPKWALIGYSAPFTLGWLIIILSRSGVQLLIGRSILGFAIGALSGTAPTYVVDIATVKIRGTLGAFFQLSIVTGILIAYSIGAYLYWQTASVISMVPTIMMSVLMYYMPEGPSWLVMKKRHLEAKQVLFKIRGLNSDVEKEFEALVKESESKHDQTFRISIYLQRRHLFPLLLSLGLMLFQQFCGVNAVMFYSTGILNEAGSTISASVGTIIIGFAQWVATIIGTGMVDYVGRKVLLIISGLLHVISMAVFGIYYTISRDGEQLKWLGWIPVVSMVIFIIGFSIGWGPVPWLMVAEITPQESKSSTSALATCSNWLSAFVVTKTFKQLQEAMTKHGVFYFFASISFLSILFTIFLLPETKNKTYDEIRRIFEPKLPPAAAPKEIKKDLSATIESQEPSSSSSTSA